jgi:LmbE family N-acetylglucosaminyl deacetylase
MLMPDPVSQHRVVAVLAHPDDEVLGAGGTLARHAAAGDEVHLVFIADGVGARGGDQVAVDKRAAAARRAAAILGAREPLLLGFPDNAIDTVGLLKLVKSIEMVISNLKPQTIYTHHSGDLNIDHVLCHRAVMTACRPLPGSTVRRIFAMEVASSTEWAPELNSTFVPSRFVDVSATREAKRRALEVYDNEMRPFPHPRSYEAVEALSRWRGASVGLQWAEAFAVLRDIES